jgi:ketosteroid isomerase-like protein
MSQENVEIVRRASEARNRGDVDAALRDFHPEVEFDWSESRAGASGMVESVIRGRDQVRAGMLEFLDAWENVTWQQQEILEVGPDQVINVSNVRFRGRDGIEIGDRGAVLWTFDGDMAVRLKFFPSKERALEAAGLSEQDVHADS